jgi:hypothetical protein
MIPSYPDHLMRSQPARWTIVIAAWIALGAAAYLVVRTHKQIAASTAASRTVDVRAREAGNALADLRAGQQAYVAAGQGVAFWVPKVAATTTAATAALTALRQAVTSSAAATTLDEAANSLAEFVNIDKRARDYINAGQSLMAADVIFTEGNQTIAAAAQYVETARQTEHQASEAREAELRQEQALTAGGAAVLVALLVLLLAPAGRESDDVALKPEGTLSIRPAQTDAEGIVSHARPATQVRPAPPGHPRPAVPRSTVVLKAAADLATDFGRVRDSDELSRLLARSADMLDASGLVVWVGTTDGGDLQPVLAHGYTPEILARMPAVPRSADNAAATAYRTGTLQIVLSRPGASNGAIVAPILSADGCVGALSAEIKNGGEGSEAVQAVAAIVAAHLAGMVSAPATETPAVESKAAAQG